MTRIQIEYPPHTLYSQKVRVRITDVNAANHMGFDNMVCILNDVSAGFLNAFGIDRTGKADIGVIITDLVVKYISESFFGDFLMVDVAVGDISRKGIDLVLRTTNQTNGKVTSLARIGVLFFNYRQRRSVPVPEDFLRRISRI